MYWFIVYLSTLCAGAYVLYLHPLTVTSYRSEESGGSDSEDGSVSRRKKKSSREKDKSKKAKKDKAGKGYKHVHVWVTGIYNNLYII